MQIQWPPAAECCLNVFPFSLMHFHTSKSSSLQARYNVVLKIGGKITVKKLAPLMASSNTVNFHMRLKIDIVIECRKRSGSLY